MQGEAVHFEQELVGHVASLTFADLSPEAVDAAKRLLLWTLGTSIAGARDRGSDSVVDVVERLHEAGSGPCTIIGSPGGYPVALAGFANGVFAKALEFEDKHWIGNSHAYAVGVAVVPAALAALEWVGGGDGRELLTAIAAATDVEMRMISAAPHAIETSFNSTYVFGTMGAAIVAGKLLCLTDEQLQDALGLATTQAFSTYQGHAEHSIAVRMQMGFCVRNGIYAAVMAQAGIGGPRQSMSGRHGLYAAFFGECDQEAALRDVGTVFQGTRLGYKGYPCCAAMHQAIHALFDAKSRHGIDAADVAEITVHGAPSMAITCTPIAKKRRPVDHVDQEFSLPWAIACALTAERLSLADFSEKALGDEQRLALAQRVSAELDAPDDGVYVEVRTTSGQVLRSEPIGPPYGHPDNPYDWNSIIRAYRDCAFHQAARPSDDVIEALQEEVLALEDVEDARQLIQPLADAWKPASS
jgi:2-methylcitrate dehydratase PrpD